MAQRLPREFNRLRSGGSGRQFMPRQARKFIAARRHHCQQAANGSRIAVTSSVADHRNWYAQDQRVRVYLDACSCHASSATGQPFERTRGDVLLWCRAALARATGFTELVKTGVARTVHRPAAGLPVIKQPPDYCCRSESPARHRLGVCRCRQTTIITTSAVTGDVVKSYTGHDSARPAMVKSA